MSLGITRNPGESWLDCALRYAAPWGLEEEVREEYEWLRRSEPEEDAALHACMEWDVAALYDDAGEEHRVTVTVEPALDPEDPF